VWFTILKIDADDYAENLHEEIIQQVGNEFNIFREIGPRQFEDGMYSKLHITNEHLEEAYLWILFPNGVIDVLYIVDDTDTDIIDYQRGTQNFNEVIEQLRELV
jgi:hypothetical protein